MTLKTQILRSLFISIICIQINHAQNIIPIDTLHWDIKAKSYVIEHHMGKDAIYIQSGGLILKDGNFKNGTIEFDIILKEKPMFPGISFRGSDDFTNAEEWYMRPHLPGKPDANQAAANINGVTPWQLCFGPKYSFPYDYKYGEWTHVKLVVNDNKAQVFMDHSKTPNLSWTLFHEPKAGGVLIRGGSTAMHIADIIIDKTTPQIKNFEPIERQALEGIIQEWEISDMFEEKLLNDPSKLESLIKSRTWQGNIKVEEGTAANISRLQKLYNGAPGNTVFAKVIIDSDKDQLKFLEFGYSDRVVAILNGKPIYRGTNKWRSRDYRYLGTIGLFDGIYLNLKKGKNTLLMAVSEDFGGWLITGRITD